MFIVVAAISGLTNKDTVLPPPAPIKTAAVIQPDKAHTETPPPTASINSDNSAWSDQTKSEIPTGSGVPLKDALNFPVTIVVTRRIDVLNETGGFGVDSGDELVVLRKQGDKYIVSHQDKEYAVNLNLIEDMKVR